MSTCNFYNGNEQCDNPVVGDEALCETHKGAKCSYCGAQAVKVYSAINGKYTGKQSCGDMQCDLRHFYVEHGEHLALISMAEEWLKVEPAKVMVAPIDDGTKCKAGFLLTDDDGKAMWSTIFIRNCPVSEMVELMRTYEFFLSTGRELVVKYEIVKDGTLDLILS